MALNEAAYQTPAELEEALRNVVNVLRKQQAPIEHLIDPVAAAGMSSAPDAWQVR